MEIAAVHPGSPRFPSRSSPRADPARPGAGPRRIRVDVAGRSRSDPAAAGGAAAGALPLGEGGPPAEVPGVQDSLLVGGPGPATELFRSRRWPVHTIAVGSAAGDRRVSGVLRAIAESTGGRHHEAPA